MINKKCNLCGNTMTEKGTKIIGGATYYLLFCEKCHHNVARSES